MNLIKTKISPKQIETNFGRIVVRDGNVEVTATTIVYNDMFDQATQTYTYEMGLYYPGRLTEPKFTTAIHGVQNGLKLPMEKPHYGLTQDEFEAAIVKGEKISVPTRN